MFTLTYYHNWPAAIVADPLTRLMMQADGVSDASLLTLLFNVAEQRQRWAVDHFPATDQFPRPDPPSEVIEQTCPALTRTDVDAS